jgi:hypothetical protein
VKEKALLMNNNPQVQRTGQEEADVSLAFKEFEQDGVIRLNVSQVEEEWIGIRVQKPANAMRELHR